MLLSAFYSEVGTELINLLVSFGTLCSGLASKMGITAEWSDGDFRRAAEFAENYGPDLHATAEDFEKLESLLKEKRMFLLVMLENPNLLEHEIFTDTLWAVFHLTDELTARDGFLRTAGDGYSSP